MLTISGKDRDYWQHCNICNHTSQGVKMRPKTDLNFASLTKSYMYKSPDGDDIQLKTLATAKNFLLAGKFILIVTWAIIGIYCLRTHSQVYSLNMDVLFTKNCDVKRRMEVILRTKSATNGRLRHFYIVNFVNKQRHH